MNRRRFLSGALVTGAALALPSTERAKPKVRAITAFLTLDRAQYQEQVQETLRMLRQAKRSIEAGGYQAESLRIVTQPFPHYSRGLSRPDALRFFREYDALAAKESFDPNIGPAMLGDGDDPAQAELLGEILSTTKVVEGSVVIAGEDGIHWKCITAAAGLVKFVEEHSPGSAANFNFTATGCLAPYAPFYHRDPTLARRF